MIQSLPSGSRHYVSNHLTTDILQRSPPRLFTVAACSGLKPTPDGRLRGACPHLPCSSATTSLRKPSRHTLIQVPAPLRIAAHVRDPLLSDLGGEHWTKPVPPKPDCLVADVDPAL